MAYGVPAMLFSVAFANPCSAIQVSGYASPPPTPITQAPARDLVTAAPSQEPSRYAPPVHVTPPSPGQRPSRAVFNSESVNGRRNSTQLVSYAGRPAVTKLSDETLAAPPLQPVRMPTYQVAPQPPVAPHPPVTSSGNAANRFVGLHGYEKQPTLAAPTAPQERYRRPGLQDHISAALKRTSRARNARKGQPTEAVREEIFETSEPTFDARTLETANHDQPAQYGSTSASGSFKRQRSVATQNDRYESPDRFDDYEELLVRHNAPVADMESDNRMPTGEWDGEAFVFEDEASDSSDFATDYQRSTRSDEDGSSKQRDTKVVRTARVAPVQAPSRDRPPRVTQSARPLSRQSRSRSLRGDQVSVLSTSRQGSDEDNEFEEIPNRLRSNRQIEKIDDFDPLNDLDDLDDPMDRDDELDDDLDDLDRDIDAELERLRDRSGDDESDDDDEDSVAKPPVKDCETFRNQLLGGSIRDIPLDISPPASSLPGSTFASSRSWTDGNGNVIATGAMQDLRRGYVILDSGQKISYARLSEADLAAVSEFWRLPTVCSVGNGGGSVQRNWIPQTFSWTASNLCHKPLFFENVQLERYGHSHGPFAQPVHSVAHFFVSLVSVTYQNAITPANECQYALGYYRPGNCAPWLKDPIPISLNGARRQALVTTGLSFIP